MNEVSPTITVLDGPAEGTTWTVRTGMSRMGRDPGCDIPVPDDASSRDHAELQWDGHHLHIRDLKSTNHTYVNGQEVQGTALGNGDEIRIGDTRLRVHLPQPFADHAAPLQQAPPARRWLRPLIVAVMTAVGLFLALLLLVKPPRPPSGRELAAAAATPTAPAPSATQGTRRASQGAAGAALEEARTLAMYERFAEARAALQLAGAAGADAVSLAEVKAEVDRRASLRVAERMRTAREAMRALDLRVARIAVTEVIEIAAADDPRRTEAEALFAELEQREKM